MIRLLFCSVAGLCLMPGSLLLAETSPGSVPSPGQGTGAIPKGPWGRLEGKTLILEPPDRFVAANPDIVDWTNETLWRFETTSTESVRSTLVDAELPGDWIHRLMNDGCLVKEADHIEIRPPDEIILGLSSKQREKLYQRLSHWNYNAFGRPYSLMPGGIRVASQWETGVASDRLALIERLSYRRGLSTKFSDIHYLFSQTPTEEERWRILKTLLREKSLSVQLRVLPGDDLNTIANYWTSHGRSKEILPLFESVVTTAGIETIDIAHLLPPLPRRLLHTYPTEAGWGVKGETPDCFWTSFSFFSDEPTDRYFDFVGHILEERYERAERPLQMGDLVLVFDSDTGRWIHACNYVAGDLVFTKNGRSFGRPWVIQPMREVVEGYLVSERLSVSFFRLRPQFRR